MTHAMKFAIANGMKVEMILEKGAQSKEHLAH